MNIYFTVKSVGKRRPFLTKKEYVLSTRPNTLKELIEEIVVYHVGLYNERAEDSQLVHFLTADEMASRGAEGKIGFGTRYDERQANDRDAIQTALLAFEDGLYRVFVRDEEVSELDARIDLRGGDDIAFIKFTMLAGRQW
ncbi:hypothetical protein SAMN02799630_05544 [Paenibacillus sp. UNCCL117]|uniref:hypothetical protein n=1 Tax=unclassified Paenibacillus TaxID=185978 RepID=UPI000890E971|nr:MULTISPECIES: hypothetical protein [unclassified Paenibacillus]SDE48894.1 hypothetical protein SAMN04488602_13023 [Paenibacillus sp. cl123]SFW66765.1 hypothetical protein SAMN02799630_05544 [Paenibacillus sp. UNCCL117]